MVFKWGIWGGIIGFFGTAIMLISSGGFSAIAANGVVAFIKVCAMIGLVGFCAGIIVRKWIFRTFWA